MNVTIRNAKPAIMARGRQIMGIPISREVPRFTLKDNPLRDCRTLVEGLRSNRMIP